LPHGKSKDEETTNNTGGSSRAFKADQKEDLSLSFKKPDGKTPKCLFAVLSPKRPYLY
tara:strand:+ start:135 stop:308 length:174 start_codon:yes stop_codon:yes gene_type:complete